MQREAGLASSTPGGGPAAAWIAQAYRAAIQHHQAGRFAQAEALYRQILGLDPANADALHQLGILAYQMRRPDAGEVFLTKAIAADPRVPAFHYHLGLVLQEQGKTDAAIAAYRRALTLKAGYHLAHNNLGIALQAKGELEAARASYARAAELAPNFPDAHHNLGSAAMALGQPARAETAFRRAAELAPADPAAHFHLAHARHRLERLDEAAAGYRRALGLKADYPEAHFNLALVLLAQGRAAEAADGFRRTAALAPAFADAHAKLGYLAMLDDRPADALPAYAQAAALEPGKPEAHNNVGSALQAMGRLDEALAAFDRALALDPAYPEGHYNRGVALLSLGRLEEAVAAFERSVSLRPDYAEAHNNLGSALQERGRLGEAVAAYGRSVALKPDHAPAHSNLGSALLEQGRRLDALASFDAALALKPDFAGGGSARLMALQYGAELDAAGLAAEHARWGDLHGIAALPAAHPNGRDPERTLRVGFVSADLRAHSVAYFLEPLLRARHPAAFEATCYAEVARPDAVTERLQGLSDRWRSSVGLSAEALAEQVRADGVDILVDLSGHTDRHRLLAFAHSGAPVQATWLGYPNTTGLAAMDYRLVDPITDPPGAADAWAREKLVRMDGGFLCYAPPADAPEVATPPSSRGERFTFGSFNNPSKLSDGAVEAWAEILARVPGARLLLKGRPFADAEARAVVEARFAAHGVGAERLLLKGWIPSSGSHLEAYGLVDVALDPFPYNGTTTTCEALLMGVPVVTVAGDRHAGRVGMSLLTHAGAPELIAANRGAYVELAVSLAGDPARLADLRSALRPRLLASSLTDAPAFARRFESALRLMWRRWCAGEAPAPLTAA